LVYLRRDPKQMQEAWVFDAKTSEYLGQAFLLPEVSALAYKSDVGKTELQRQIAIKRQSNKIQKALASTDTSISIEEKVSLLAGYNKIANEMKERTTQNLNINEIAPVTITAMDKVLKRKKEVEGQSNEAASYYEKINKIQEKLEMQEKKRSLFFFPSDKEEHEKRLQAGER
jgi:vacuolar-type H+-ATPase catalytic subunit A/Vma1